MAQWLQVLCCASMRLQFMSPELMYEAECSGQVCGPSTKVGRGRRLAGFLTNQSITAPGSEQDPAVQTNKE